MIALTPVDIQDSALTAYGYEPVSQILAVTLRGDSDTLHYGPGVPQEAYDALVQSVAYHEDPTADMFSTTAPKLPDHVLDDLVRGPVGSPIYPCTRIAGAAVADDSALEDPTLPPSPPPAPSPAPTPSPSPSPSPAPLPSPAPAPAQG